MPNILIKLPSGVLDTESRKRLGKDISEAAAKVERIPDDPKKHFLCWVAIDEVAVGNWTCGGADVTDGIIPVIAVVNIPQGVLDHAARAEYVRAVHAVMVESLSADARRVMTSCIVNEVAEGTWGANGAIWGLADFALHAGFAHLQDRLAMTA
ncbi:hypothetical protein BH11PSE11_BH11PSE11_27170 [soil metagenome]